MYLCYHHNDMDGKGAADQVYRYLTRSGVKCFPSMFIMRGYDEPFSENDYNNKVVFIVDLSFTKESIKKLFEICEGASEVHWIDHHASSIECVEDEDILKKLMSYNNIRFFVNNKACGAMLSFLYFNGHLRGYSSIKSIDYNIYYSNNGKTISVEDPEVNTEVIECPEYLRLIDLWDRWRYEDDINPVLFNYGTQVRNTSLFAYADKHAEEKTYNTRFWKAIETSTYLKQVINEGKIAKRYFDTNSRKSVSAGAYESIIGGYKALVLNSDGNSQVFGNKINDYDIVCLWTYNGKLGLYQYSLYSVNENINCATIANSYDAKGGGHPGAAGFSSKELLFKRR